jgi:hypothetical protein
MLTRSLVLLVCQFRHFRIMNHFHDRRQYVVEKLMRKMGLEPTQAQCLQDP